MTAVQLMTQRGGWPLNCFTLPDGRPIYGGTYFPKDQWMHVLKSLIHAYTNKKEETLEYAAKLHEGIIQSDGIQHTSNAKIELQEEKLHEMVLRWSRSFDREYGGESKAPKFPLPNNLLFLLEYGIKYEHPSTLRHVELTLDKMCLGGIYDQIGGGFARYSVDLLWKVPHFEKMLYDNAQLLSIYAKAYIHFKKPIYKRVLLQTIQWLENEMRDPTGAFYAALDADSEGVEGKFYCWEKSELNELFGENHWIHKLYSINSYGYWEEDRYIFIRKEDDSEICNLQNWTQETFESELAKLNALLLEERSKRIRPSRDEKLLTSWNALLANGLVDAYRALGDDSILLHAKTICHWVQSIRTTADGKLIRSTSKNGKIIDGFLEDYAAVIQAQLNVYSVTGELTFLTHSKQLLDYCQSNFKDPKSAFYYFDAKDSQLIARKIDIHDTVLPSANSLMAINLLWMYQLTAEESMLGQVQEMLEHIYEGMEYHPSGYSNWGRLLIRKTSTCYLVKIDPENTSGIARLNDLDLPNVMMVLTKMSETSELQLCYQTTCLLPTHSMDELIKTILE
jgi:uncharacterized protein YyaL (SSP411 family)